MLSNVLSVSVSSLLLLFSFPFIIFNVCCICGSSAIDGSSIRGNGTANGWDESLSSSDELG